MEEWHPSFLCNYNLPGKNHSAFSPSDALNDFVIREGKKTKNYQLSIPKLVRVSGSSSKFWETTHVLWLKAQGGGPCPGVGFPESLSHWSSLEMFVCMHLPGNFP